MASGFEFTEPGSNPILCVQARYGSCGNQTAVGIAFFKRVGFDARGLEFYYSQDGQRGSHKIVEAHIGGKWRPIDTTYGACWHNAVPRAPFELIATDRLIGGDKKGFKQKWNVAWLPYGSFSSPNVFNYLTSDSRCHSRWRWSSQNLSFG